ncbi:MAG: tetratricopeptide repeat protein, partial [Nitrospirales bacterium]
MRSSGKWVAPFRSFRLRWLGQAIVQICLIATVVTTAQAQKETGSPEEMILATARAAWQKGNSVRALDILTEGMQTSPRFVGFDKLRGDILATMRQNEEALEAYERVLGQVPQSLDVRWSKWSLLIRSGQADLAIEEFQRMAKHDRQNPLVHLRLAHELRVLDRLEESAKEYRLASELVPDLPGWRLSLARALFDVLQYEDARREVEAVIRMVPRGSPVETAARNLLLIVYGATKERGRRFQPIYSPDGSASLYKEWGLIRNQAWDLYANGRFQEAEPILRHVLSLRPTDHRATYELGVTLMELGQYEEAIQLLQKGIDLGPSSGPISEVFLDSIFRIGQGLAHLERWEEALLHFEILQEFSPSLPDPSESQNVPEKGAENNPDDPPILSGIPVLDQEKVAMWLERVRSHIPQSEHTLQEMPPTSDLATSPGLSNAPHQESNPKSLKVSQPIHTRASLMGRDADFSWFRFVIPSKMIFRDDMLMGSHDFIPVDPGDTFLSTQQDLYLVFALATPSYDEVALTAQCFLERSAISPDQTALVQDQVIMSMNEQSGYFRLRAPQEGWPLGLYRCGLFVGDEV